MTPSGGRDHHSQSLSMAFGGRRKSIKARIRRQFTSYSLLSVAIVSMAQIFKSTVNVLFGKMQNVIVK